MQKSFVEFMKKAYTNNEDIKWGLSIFREQENAK